MIVSSDIDPSPNLLHCLILIPQVSAGGLKLVLAVHFTGVFICLENIHALLSHVSTPCLSDYLSAALFVLLKLLEWLCMFL